ncbi:conserved membrane hypothetical protein [Verrucomicrobia bacterium]|nr:conserved membrane hypothetical protein [Verrucomicrobiota bacterium]
MKSTVRVAAPPGKPLLIYDGDCSFCERWVGRWRRLTGPAITYVPAQDARLAARFPEVPREQMTTAVHLIASDGSIFSGAEAVLRALAQRPQERWLLDWYEHSPPFARVAEALYGLVAGHRTFLSALTRAACGEHLGPATYSLTRVVFLRALGLIYLAAFLSLWVQIIGLVGADGILPAKLTMAGVRQQMEAAGIGADRYRMVPTLCWFNASDRCLEVQCAAGTFLAAVLVFGLAPAPCLFLLWIIYLSLVTVGRDFLGFQWDNLLLEAGWLAIFLAPLQLRLSGSHCPPPSRVVLWLLWWLLFRLMFESGCVKLLSGDPVWRNLTALKYHYETQPLPTWIAWYANPLPMWTQKLSVAFMFCIELGPPFLIFAPRRLRQFGCLVLITLQVLIFLTGNYCFFNLLTMALCLLLLDDVVLQRLLPARWRSAGERAKEEESIATTADLAPPAVTEPLAQEGGAEPANSPSSQPRQHTWPGLVTVPLACVILLVSLMQICAMFRLRLPWPRALVTVYATLAPLRSLNSYGFFPPPARKSSSKAATTRSLGYPMSSSINLATCVGGLTSSLRINRAWIGKCGSRRSVLTNRIPGLSTFASDSSRAHPRRWCCLNKIPFPRLRLATSARGLTTIISPIGRPGAKRAHGGGAPKRENTCR